MSIKGVIFDMDGVMADTESQSNLGWLRAARSKGVEMPMWLIDSFKGAPASLSAVYFDEYYKGTQNYWEMREMRSEYVYEIRDREGIPVKAGLHELLEYIKNNGLKCAVATSTRRSSATNTLHQIGAWDYLDSIVFGDEVEHGKPEPDIFLKAAEAIGVKPSECIVIEDSINGIKAGHAAGMTVVHVPDTIVVEPEVRKLAGYVVESLKDVNKVLDGSYVAPREERTYVNLVFVDRVRVVNKLALVDCEKEELADLCEKPDKEELADLCERLAREELADLCERLAREEGFSAYDLDLAWLMGVLDSKVNHGLDTRRLYELIPELLGDGIKCEDLSDSVIMLLLNVIDAYHKGINGEFDSAFEKRFFKILRKANNKIGK